MDNENTTEIICPVCARVFETFKDMIEHSIEEHDLKRGEILKYVEN